MFFERAYEYWAALIGMGLYLFTRAGEGEPVSRKLASIVTSALLAFASSEAVARYLGGNEVLAAIVIMGVGQMLLDLARALISDRDFIKSLL